MRPSHFLLSGLLASSLAQADGLSRPDAHAPIGVMGEHTHHAGEWMLSYRFMDMQMDGNRDGSERLSTQEVYDRGYHVAAQEMSMRMHMLGAMYAPTDQLTLMAMVPFVELEMDHTSNPMMAALNSEFTTESSGLGDIKLGGLYTLHNADGQQFIANFTLSVPTGSIDEEDELANPMMGEMQMPYPMQLGSGTYDVIPGITYVGKNEQLSWGAQAKLTIRTGENDNGYTLGDRYQFTSWLAKPLNQHISLSGRIHYENWDNIDGEDEELMVSPAMVATADPDLRAGERTDLGLGLNFIFAGMRAANHRIALEYLQPVQQDLDGPQLETDAVLVVGYQVAL